MDGENTTEVNFSIYVGENIIPHSDNGKDVTIEGIGREVMKLLKIRKAHDMIMRVFHSLENRQGFLMTEQEQEANNTPAVKFIGIGGGIVVRINKFMRDYSNNR